MEWNEILQKIVDTVETHLQQKEEPVDIDEITQIAGCSFGFFQKVFSYMNGISFSEYVRFRKLTLSGYDLKSTDIKVVDLSYKYGYDSPTSFTKAFQQFHGVSPKEARTNQVELRVYPKLQISAKQQYSWKIEHKSSFRLIGKTVKISCEDGRHYMKIPEFWNTCQKNGDFYRLISMDTGNPRGVFGVINAYSAQPNEMEYAIMTISDKKLPEGFHELLIPEATWAVFDCMGPAPQAIQNGWNYLTNEWLLKYPFQHAPCPELEWYSDGNSYDEKYLSQIWIPILEDK